MKNSLVIGAMLLFSTLAFAGPKAVTVVFDKTTTVGSVTLAPGEYRVKVDGANAVFTNNTNFKAVSTPVKVETGEKKFKDTAVDSIRTPAGETVNAITIGGSSTKLEFGKQSAATN